VSPLYNRASQTDHLCLCRCWNGFAVNLGDPRQCCNCYTAHLVTVIQHILSGSVVCARSAFLRCFEKPKRSLKLSQRSLKINRTALYHPLRIYINLHRKNTLCARMCAMPCPAVLFIILLLTLEQRVSNLCGLRPSVSLVKALLRNT